MIFFRNLIKNLNPLWVFGFVLSLAVIGWAQDAREAQANKSATDAGVSSANNVIVSLDTIKRPRATASKPAPNVNWAQEKTVRSQLASQQKSLEGLAARAKNERAGSGRISQELADQLTTAGDSYLATTQKYSEIWAQGKSATRANLALEAGKAQKAAIDVIIAGADGDKISTLNSVQSELSKARRAYLKEAASTGELSNQDKADLRKNLVPRANQLVQEATGLVNEATTLFDQIKSETQSLTSKEGIVSGLSSCASGGGGGGPQNIAQKLLSPVTNLLSLTRGLASNAQELVSDIGVL
jgi:hypothetical protein